MPGAFDEIRNSLVRHWGEMSGYWGINRTMAEIHALLFISTEPLCTDDIMQQLQISRGNASMNLRGLVDWGLIRRVHKLGDRKEYFQADTDIWHMFETIMRERRRREVEPIVATIDRCLEIVNGPALADSDPRQIEECRKRLENLRGFLGGMSKVFETVLRFGGQGIADLLKLIDLPPELLGSIQASIGQAGARPAEPRQPAAGGGPKSFQRPSMPAAPPRAPANSASSEEVSSGKSTRARRRPSKPSRTPQTPRPSAYKRRLR